MTRPRIWIDGRPMDTILPTGELKLSSRVTDRGVGPWEARWGVVRHDLRRHPLIRDRALIDVRLGGLVIWSGVLPEANLDADELVASGAIRDGETAVPFNAAGYLTTIPNVALDQGIARGALSWRRPASISAVALAGPDGTATTDEPEITSINRLMDAVGDRFDTYWEVKPDRRVGLRSLTEANPTVLLAPGVGELGTTSTDRVDVIALRYNSATSGHLATVRYPATTPEGGSETGIDVTNMGPITGALSLAQGIWNRTRGLSGWTNGYTVAAGQVCNRYGGRMHLGLVAAGMAMRAIGAPDPRDGTKAHTDTVIGECEWDTEERTLQLNPVGLVASTLDAVLEDLAPGAQVLG